MKPQVKKANRDELIQRLLIKFRICSRNQISKIIFDYNSNPVNVCNRVLKRLVLQDKVLAIPRTKDKYYLYTNNPSHIHPKSNKIDHHLKIVDFYIESGQPENFVIEPVLGSYEPDVLYRNGMNQSVCVEIQITPISVKKMQEKLDCFMKEYGKEHDSKLFMICSDYPYNGLTCEKGFKILKKGLPKEIYY